MSTDLKVESQCNEACLKANRMLGLIKRTFVAKTPEAMLNLYKTLVRVSDSVSSPLFDSILRIAKSGFPFCQLNGS